MCVILIVCVYVICYTVHDMPDMYSTLLIRVTCNDYDTDKMFTSLIFGHPKNPRWNS